MADESVITVDPSHLIWTSFDDDDWNGTTCSQWIRLVSGKSLVLHQPGDIKVELLKKIVSALESVGCSVEVEKSQP